MASSHCPFFRFNHPIWCEDLEGLGQVLQEQWSWVLHRIAAVSRENHIKNSSKRQKYLWFHEKSYKSK